MGFRRLSVFNVFFLLKIFSNFDGLIGTSHGKSKNSCIAHVSFLAISFPVQYKELDL